MADDYTPGLVLETLGSFPHGATAARLAGSLTAVLGRAVTARAVLQTLYQLQRDGQVSGERTRSGPYIWTAAGR
jgi:hypothetical protein